MKQKTITKSALSLQVEETGKTLPDESDQIIADLQSRLQRLQNQVSEYKKKEEKEHLYIKDREFI